VVAAAAGAATTTSATSPPPPPTTTTPTTGTTKRKVDPRHQIQTSSRPVRGPSSCPSEQKFRLTPWTFTPPSRITLRSLQSKTLLLTDVHCGAFNCNTTTNQSSNRDYSRSSLKPWRTRAIAEITADPRTAFKIRPPLSRYLSSRVQSGC